MSNYSNEYANDFRKIGLRIFECPIKIQIRYKCQWMSCGSSAFRSNCSENINVCRTFRKKNSSHLSKKVSLWIVIGTISSEVDNLVLYTLGWMAAVLIELISCLESRHNMLIISDTHVLSLICITIVHILSW